MCASEHIYRREFEFHFFFLIQCVQSAKMAKLMSYIFLSTTLLFLFNNMDLGACTPRRVRAKKAYNALTHIVPFMYRSKNSSSYSCCLLSEGHHTRTVTHQIEVRSDLLGLNEYWTGTHTDTYTQYALFI